ncbi:UDP-3-O-(3-hydroxymyristoyl)glucosamine N-acyltransferase [candidate division KSB1 bacterium]|nr:UDP-3-O-(3-hydroxymyristoyl)glucosamine N-acyltransferase [candidate division KSB1 bacterium]RQW05748.1 MAG: UDP-3-O-(3-hydroxymyristoyl)glucosamine N-acyltransferase [candidate division KSB1 bacterium]
MTITVAQIAQWINATVEGDDSIEITGLAKIEQAQSGHLTFIANPKYAKYSETTEASAILVPTNFPACPKTVLRVANPYFAFLKLAQRFYQQAPQVETGVHETAIIGAGTSVGDSVAIGAYVVVGANCAIGKGTVLFPGTFIGDGVKIGDNCLIYPNVSIREGCIIGNNCILHMGAVIGSDGFGYAFEEGKYHKLPQMGIVVLEDDVEVGANTTIDRATMGETRIQQGAKLDNLIQIAHNVQIGRHTAMASQVGISGSTKIGNYVQVGGQAGFAGHLSIGDQAKIGAQGGVTKSVPAGQFYSGYPARPFRKEMREHASLAKVPAMLKRFKELEDKVHELQERIKELSKE